MRESKQAKEATGVIWLQAAAGLLVLLAIGILAYNFDDGMRSYQEPPEISLKELDEAKQASDIPRKKFRLDCSSAVNLKLSLVGKRYGEDVAKARYVIVRTGSSYVVAEIPPDKKET